MDFDIHTVSDLLSLIFKMNEQLDLNFNAEEDLKTIYHASDEEKARLLWIELLKNGPQNTPIP